MNINDLPNDCLLAVFARLPLHCLLNTTPLVCRQWANLNTAARKGVTSLSLLLIVGDSSKFSQDHLRSPFHLVDNQRTVIQTPDLLKLSTSKWVEGKVPAELPNISHLTIVQLSDDRPNEMLHPELLSAVEHYADQLTSFACHYLNWQIAFPRRPPTLSADYQRLLALINYQMPKLRHLLLNSDLSIFDTLGGHSYLMDQSGFTSQGSLYLPVLRRLASFSFRSEDHTDVLHYSLVKFGAANGALRVRLSVPPLPPPEPIVAPSGIVYCRIGLRSVELTKGAQMDGQLWKSECCSRFLNYLTTRRIQWANFSQHISGSYMPRLAHLHLGLLDGGRNLQSLFTLLSASLPVLASLYLDLGQSLVGRLKAAEDAPELHPLPSLTSLTLRWCFDDPDHFGVVLQPVRTFPSLQSLTLEAHSGFRRCSLAECSCTLEPSPMSLRPAMWMSDWSAAVSCIRPALKHYSLRDERQLQVVKFTQLLADGSTKEVALTTDDLDDL